MDENPWILQQFLSTPSGWRATDFYKHRKAGVEISIHALRVEGDPPTTPISFSIYTFLSTPSGWRATNLSGYL